MPARTAAGLHVVDRVRRRDDRHELVGDERQRALVDGAGVGSDRTKVVGAALRRKERPRDLVGGHETRLGARFDGHVGQREAFVHGQRLDGRAAELERLVGGAVGAQAADDRKDEVFGGDAVGKAPADLDAKRLGHAQPGLPGRHADGDVGRAHAGGEGAQGAGRAGVRVGADHQVARLGVGLGHALVADAHLDVGERRSALFAEAAHELVCVGELDARRRRRVVDEEHRGGHLDVHPAQVAKLLDGQRSGAVLGDGQVDEGDHDLPGSDRLDTGVGGDDLLGDGGRHGHA